MQASGLVPPYTGSRSASAPRALERTLPSARLAPVGVDTSVSFGRQRAESHDPTGPQACQMAEPLRGLEQYRLEWLISFVACARHGGVSAAARALYRSQPRVSSHVAGLEQALGVQLFDRSARPVRLTPDGRALLVHAEKILEALRAMSETAAGSPPRSLRLMAETSIAAYVYPRLARDLTRVWPSSRLVLRETVDPIDPTFEGWDLAVAAATFGARPQGADSLALWSEPLVAVLRPDHVLAQTGLELSLPFLDGVSLINQPNQAFGGTGPFERLEVVAQAAQPQTMMAMVRHGMGVGLLGGLAALSANTDGLVLKPLGDPLCHRTISLWWHHQRIGADVHTLRRLAALIPEPAWPWDECLTAEAGAASPTK